MEKLRPLALSLFATLFTALLLPLHASNPMQAAGQTALTNLQAYEHMLPHQKAYMHTDKNSYLAGERIWFQAFVVALSNHQPDERQTNLHVELLSLDGDFVNVSLLPLEHGLAYGDIHIPDSIHEGSYVLRAFTDLMKNFDETFYFEKELTIRNPGEENYISRRERRSSRNFNDNLEEKRNEFQFGLFPEGGNLVAGTENRVAFKAANGLGRGVKAQGHLMDDKNTVVLSFETRHDGMGSFTFTPEHGSVYHAVVEFENGDDYTCLLPDLQDQGYVLRVDRRGENIHLQVTASLITTALPGDIAILAHTRGRVHFFQEANMDQAFFETSIPVSELPDGISHITFFDSNGPVAERLIFLNEKGFIEPSVEINGDEVAIHTQAGAGFRTSLSLAVLEPHGSAPERRGNIATYLMLTSDLQGDIYNPGFYFEDEPAAAEAADLLMMTHGWRRFDWEDIMKRRFPEVTYEEAEGLVVQGKVESLSDRHDFGGVQVKMATRTEGRQMYTTETDRNGHFEFEGLEYENVFMAGISVETNAPRRTYQIKLGFDEPAEASYPLTFHTEPKKVLERGDNWSRVSRPDYFHQTERISGRRAERSYYGQPDQTIYVDELSGYYNSMREVLTRNVRGLTYRDGNIFLRGPISFEASSRPAFIVDGNTVDQGVFLSLRPEDISRVEVLSGSSAAILGVRGAAGALIAYTQRSSAGMADQEFAIRGYNMPAAFYESEISSDNYKDYSIPITRFWKANITPGEDGVTHITLPEELDNVNNLIFIEGLDEEGNIYLYENL